MKKKEVKSRYRRSNLELAGFSRQHLRAIKRISEMAQVHVSRVFTDVIEIGIAAVMSNYKPMIEMEEERARRADSLKKLFSYEQKNGETTGSGVSEERDELVRVEYEPLPPFEGTSTGAALEFPATSVVRLGDDVVGPGHETETLEAAGSDDSESIVLGG